MNLNGFNSQSHLFDAHCHLQDERLMPYLNAVLERAAMANVACVMCCGSSENDWAVVADLSPSRPKVVKSYGLHPLYVGQRSPEWASRLRGYLSRAPAAVGEIGLDHAVEPRNDADQEEVFLAQLEMSRELGRPASFHCRRAWGRLLELLRGFGEHQPGFVLHSYSGAADLVEPLAKLGAYFSFSGTITRGNNTRGHAAAQAVPADRLLVESDAPDLMPVTDAEPSLRDAEGKPVNEPANITLVVNKLAELRGCLPSEIVRQTWTNARRLFHDVLVQCR